MNNIIDDLTNQLEQTKDTIREILRASKVKGAKTKTVTLGGEKIQIVEDRVDEYKRAIKNRDYLTESIASLKKIVPAVERHVESDAEVLTKPETELTSAPEKIDALKPAVEFGGEGTAVLSEETPLPLAVDGDSVDEIDSSKLFSEEPAASSADEDLEAETAEFMNGIIQSIRGAAEPAAAESTVTTVAKEAPLPVDNSDVELPVLSLTDTWHLTDLVLSYRRGRDYSPTDDDLKLLYRLQNMSEDAINKIRLNDGIRTAFTKDLLTQLISHYKYSGVRKMFTMDLDAGRTDSGPTLTEAIADPSLVRQSESDRDIFSSFNTAASTESIRREAATSAADLTDLDQIIDEVTGDALGGPASEKAKLDRIIAEVTSEAPAPEEAAFSFGTLSDILGESLEGPAEELSSKHDTQNGFPRYSYTRTSGVAAADVPAEEDDDKLVVPDESVLEPTSAPADESGDSASSTSGDGSSDATTNDEEEDKNKRPIPQSYEEALAFLEELKNGKKDEHKKEPEKKDKPKGKKVKLRTKIKNALSNPFKKFTLLKGITFLKMKNHSKAYCDSLAELAQIKQCYKGLNCADAAERLREINRQLREDVRAQVTNKEYKKLQNSYLDLVCKVDRFHHFNVNLTEEARRGI